MKIYFNLQYGKLKDKGVEININGWTKSLQNQLKMNIQPLIEGTHNKNKSCGADIQREADMHKWREIDP